LVRYLVKGTLADFTRAMRALAAGDLEAAKADFIFAPVIVHSHDEIGDMALSFNRLQEEMDTQPAALQAREPAFRKPAAHLRRPTSDCACAYPFSGG
jgi:methyl-accepting chemotaxis protein